MLIVLVWLVDYLFGLLCLEFWFARWGLVVLICCFLFCFVFLWGGLLLIVVVCLDLPFVCGSGVLLECWCFYGSLWV